MLKGVNGMPPVEGDISQVRLRLLTKTKPEYPNKRFVEFHMTREDGQFMGGYGFAYEPRKG